MRVLSFSSFAKKQAPAQGQDWSQQEIADFYRAHRLLAENGAAIGIDRGLTDIGEPWIVFYDLMTQDVFLHVGRIDGQCILVCDALGIKLKAGGISDLVLQFEASVRDHISVRAERQGNVVLHPAARIIMSISAVFLLSKLDGSGAAHAGEAPTTEAVSAAEVVKKVDVTPLVRAQTALARLFDSVESPRAVASLAGAILTGELLINLQPIAHQETVTGETAEAVIEVAHLPRAPDTSLNEAETTIDVSHIEAGIEKAPSPKLALASSVVTGAEQAQAEYQNDHLSSEEKIVFFAPQAVDRSVDLFPDMAPIGAVVATVKAAEPVPAVVADKGTPEAIDVVQSILGRSLKSLGDGVVTLAGVQPDVNKGGVVTVDLTVPTALPEISLSTLEQLDDTVGFYLQTSLSDSGLHSMLTYFLTSMPGFEIEYIGGRILIEQQNTNALAAGDIGLWTNVLHDGSTISVIGQAALIDDIGMFVS